MWLVIIKWWHHDSDYNCQSEVRKWIEWTTKTFSFSKCCAFLTISVVTFFEFWSALITFFQYVCLLYSLCNMHTDVTIRYWYKWYHNVTILLDHWIDVIMTTMASQITSPTVVYSIVYLGADQRKHQSRASLAFVLWIHRDRWILRTKGQ